MAYDGRYDDPVYINRFLADLKFTDEELSESVDSSMSDGNRMNKDENAQQVTEPKFSNGIDTPAIVSAASSPATGTRAPPSTPESKPIVAVNIKHMPSIDEDDGSVGDQVRQSSPRPGAQPFRATAHTFYPTQDSPSSPALTSMANETPSISFQGLDAKTAADTRNYQQNVLANYKQEAEARMALNKALLASTNRVEQVRETGALNGSTVEITRFDDSHVIAGPDEVEEPTNYVLDAHDGHTSSTSTEPFPETQDESTAITDVSNDDDNSSVNIIVDAPHTPNSSKSHNPPIVIATPSEATIASKGNISKTDHTGSTENRSAKHRAFTKEESREAAIFFSSWGSPSNRKTSPARVRKIILSDLPNAADFTLVQSLVHGGAIEVMTLSQSANGTTNAFVTFTNADGCELYLKQYPNGLDFKHKGKKYTAFVDKGHDVDVISGVLQSSLDCGASRVIKVEGADDDWSMKALHKIAEGTTGRRKVESISDNYRNESRTIVFRFTKIADAVAFRGQLFRSPEWEDASIQFMTDPCEKATGIHWD